MSANGCVPKISFYDYENIFRGLYLIDKTTDHFKPKELKEHAVFVREEKCIVFHNVCINTTASTQIHLHNSSLVPADISAKIISSEAATFDIGPKKLEILPYSDGSINIRFTPTKIQNYTGTLDVQLIMPNNFKSQSAQYKLSGEGRIPEIRILEPFCEGSVFKNFVYNPTLVGKSAVKPIVFENIGDFPCRAIIEVSEDVDDVFSLVLDEAIPLLNYYSLTETNNMKHQTAVNLIPGEKATLGLNYCPKKCGTDKCTIKLHVQFNPFELYIINVEAQCFVEDIIIEGLPTTNPFIQKSKTSMISMGTMSYCTNYLIDFGNSFLNSLQKMKFKIMNQSTVDIYKFEFRAISDVTFIPSIGHLKPAAKKEVIVTFLSSDPVSHIQVSLNLLHNLLISVIIYT